MAELEQEFRSGEKDLAALVSEAKLRERAARQKALFYTILPVIIGTIFLAVSLVKVSRLEKTATDLTNQIAGKKAELSELKTKKEALEDSLKVTTTTLVDINNDPNNAREKARQALKIVSDKVPAPSPVVTQPAIASGFVDNNNFKGPAQTRITVEVTPDRALLDSSTRPHTLFTYRIDGESTHDVSDQTSFSFSLDKSKDVLLIFDFAREGTGGYTIKQTASTGRNRSKQFHLDPSQGRVGRGVKLNFAVE